YRTDPDLADILVRRSLPTLQWLREKGVRFAPILRRQVFEINGQFKFWGVLTLESWGGGPGLVDSLTKAARDAGVEIAYGVRATSILRTATTVTGVRTLVDGEEYDVSANAVVLACGGFEANAAWRAKY